MRAKEIPYSINDALTYLHHAADSRGDTALARAYVERIGEVVEQVEKWAGIKWVIWPGQPDYYPDLPGARSNGRAILQHPNSAHDVRVGYLTAGLSGDFGISYLLAEVAGPARALELAYLNTVVEADDALSLGLLTEIVPDTELEARIAELATGPAAARTLALGKFKENVALARRVALRDAIRHESTNQPRLAHCGRAGGRGRVHREAPAPFPGFLTLESAGLSLAALVASANRAVGNTATIPTIMALQAIADQRAQSGEAPPAAPFWDVQVETLGPEALAELQLERVRWQVERCRAGSSLYHGKLAASGVEPGDLRALADVARLPIVTKDELRADQASHPPFGSFAVADQSTWRELHPSSGTTGTAVNTIWSAGDVSRITDMTARTMWQFGVRPGDVIQNAFAYGLWVAGISAHYAAGAIGALVIPVGTSVTTEKQIGYLTSAHSTVLLGTPSYALHIAEELGRQGKGRDGLSLRLGCFGGEAGTENSSTRGQIERGLGLDAFDYYGLAEVGPTFASECSAKAGLHFAEDHVLVECVDSETREPVADGELGVLVFTHLTREATPMIRYWSNDYARLTHAPCECGRTHVRALGGILGRHDDLVVYKGAKFYPTQVEKAIRAFDELSHEFKIEIIRERGGSLVTDCTVVAEWAESPVEGCESRVVRSLRAELGVTPHLRIEPSGTLERTAFKAARIVTL
jgi:phenylacetate-CoA ligase